MANRALLGSLLNVYEQQPEARLEDFVAVCIHGFVEIKPVYIDSARQTVKLAVISRRSTGRVGTRYHSRGIDMQGHVSNFVETEQIIIDGTDRISSLLQVRGSIPLYWRQNIDMRYKPIIEVYNFDENVLECS